MNDALCCLLHLYYGLHQADVLNPLHDTIGMESSGTHLRVDQADTEITWVTETKGNQ
ncbi:hypothetical protein OROHE_007255 [Orobanche hederae]